MSLYYDEQNEEVLKEKRVQTGEVVSTEISTHSEEYDYLFTRIQQDEKTIKAKQIKALSSFDTN